MRWDVRETDTQLLGENGIYFTQSLFREFGADCGPYTMGPRDKVINGEKIISAYKIYMDSVNEYEAAMRIVGDMHHWRKLCELDWFLHGVPKAKDKRITSGLLQWREDHAMKREAEQLQLLTAAAQTGNVQAAKYLNEYTGKKLSSKSKIQETKKSSPEDAKVLQLLKAVKDVG